MNDLRLAIRQLLTESLVLAALGGFLGLLLAFWSIHALNGFHPFPRPFTIDLCVVGWTAALVGVTALLFGSAPVLLLARIELSEALKDKAARASSVRSHRLRSSLVVCEIVLALVLLCGAGLLLRSFVRCQAIERGFNPHHVLNLGVNLYKDRYPHPAQVIEFGRNVLAQLERLPGTDCAALTSPIRLDTRPGRWGFTTPGWQADPAVALPFVDALAVSADYFRVLQIPLPRGRPFTRQEAEQGAEAAIVSEHLAQRLWPGDDPIGQPLKLETAGSDPPWLSVIGVTKDARGHSFPGTLSEALGLYVPFALKVPFAMKRSPGGRLDSMSFYVRTTGEPKAQTSAARRAVLAVDAQQPILFVRTMEEKLYREGFNRRVLAWLVGVFALGALALAMVGIYGVMACSVSERTSEIGIRLALGAQRGDVLRLILKQGMRLLMMGLPLGLAGSVAMSRVLKGQLFGVSATDPATLVGVSLLLAAVALLACYVPARRATRVDPMVALRYE